MNEASLLQGFKTIFAEGYDSATPLWDRIAAKIESDGGSEEYGWLGGLAGMREMHGERQPQGLKSYDFTIKNIEFEESVRVKRSDIRDSKIATYNNMVRILGENYRTFPDEKIFGLINLADTKVSYDGQNFADTDHVQLSAAGVQENWSNKGTSELSATTFNVARLALETARNDSGKLVNKAPKFLLVVPPSKRALAEGIVLQEHLAGGENNPNYQAAELLVHGEVASNRWALLDVSSPTARPFVWQVREEVPFEAQEEGSHEDFFRKENFYGSYFRGNAGFGEYRKAYIAVI
jgi:phage major head subunit gpT-like protein